MYCRIYYSMRFFAIHMKRPSSLGEWEVDPARLAVF